MFWGCAPFANGNWKTPFTDITVLYRRSTMLLSIFYYGYNCNVSDSHIYACAFVYISETMIYFNDNTI